jgi:hypothetical protein
MQRGIRKKKNNRKNMTKSELGAIGEFLAELNYIRQLNKETESYDTSCLYIRTLICLP